MATNFDINAFVIERPTKAIFMNSDDTTAWYTNQVQDLKVKVDGEEQTKQDAAGNTIATVTKGKTCTASFNVAVYDLNILAALNGTEKEVATTTSKITTPAFEEVTITTSNKESIVLKYPVKAVGTKYSVSVTTLTKDGSPKRIFKQGSATSAGVFTYTSASKTVAFASGDLSEGDQVLIVYEYDATQAVRVVASGDKFPTAGKLYVQVAGFDICDQNTRVYAYYRFPTAKLTSSYETDIDLETTIPMEFNCAVDYCGTDKKFYDVVVPSATPTAEE